MSRVKIIEFPQPQPIRFRDDQHPDANLPQTVGNEKHFADNLNFWDIQKTYCQKWQYWDLIGVQIQIGAYYRYDNIQPFLEVLDERGNRVALINPKFSNTLTGNLHYYNGQGYGLVTYNWLFSPAEYGLFRRGVYRFRIQVGYITNNTTFYDTFTSEPQLISKEHPRTLLIKYKSTGLKNDFDWTNMQLQFRIEAVIEFDRFESDTVSYRDQRSRIRKQQAFPRRMRRLHVGRYTGGVPEWAHDIINWILASEEIIIQNKRYERDLEEELTLKQNEGRYKLFVSSVAVQEFDLAEATRSISVIPTTVFIRPATGFPYLVKSIVLTNSNSNNTVTAFQGYAIHNATQEAEFITVLNTYLAGGTLTGYFTMVGDTCFYYSGVGEAFDGGAFVILHEYTAFQLEKKFVQGTNKVFFDSLFRTRLICVEPQYNYEVYTWEFSQYSNVNVRFDFTNRGNPNTAYVRVWHDSRVEILSVSNACLVNWDDVWSPATLKAIYFRETSLTTLSLFAVNTTIETIFAVRGVLRQVLGLNIKAWINLQTVNLLDNELSTAERDNVINDLVAVNYPLRNNGLLALANQTPPTAAVGANTAAARAKFTAANWVQNY